MTTLETQEYNHNYYLKNRRLAQEYYKIYYQQHKEGIKARANQWRKDHKAWIVYQCETCGRFLAKRHGPYRFCSRKCWLKYYRLFQYIYRHAHELKVGDYIA